MQHLACIMDGNRRFAKKHGWKPWVGHKKGIDAVRTVIDFCLNNSIAYISLYTFSIENFKRSPVEKKYLFSLLVEQAHAHVDEFIKKGIHVRFVGDRDLFPQSVLHTCSQVEQKTAHGNKLQVNFLFCYGGQQEIVHAAQQLCAQVERGTLKSTDITTQEVKNALWLHDVPAPDLIFRTGGVYRLSNFMLFQAAYTELYFSPQLWPEVTEQDLQQALDTFNTRKRNFGT